MLSWLQHVLNLKAKSALQFVHHPLEGRNQIKMANTIFTIKEIKKVLAFTPAIIVQRNS
jgi:hypothetical protein